MNKNLKMIALTVSAFVIGFSINNIAMSDVTTKIAVVDVPQVVNSSSQVEALKKEQQAKAKELVTFVEKARKEVAATTDTKKKQALEEKYNKQLQTKKETMDKDYSTKLAEIDKSISNQIANQAKLGNYSLVLAKGVVLYGGDDITEAVKKAVK
jgi:Skp family chaperone for outer membrane proteins